MNWIKQNYDRFLLSLFAVVLLVCAGLLFNNARNFNSVFASLKEQVPHSNKFPAVNEEEITEREQKLAKPDEWVPRMQGSIRLPVFASVPYIANGDKLINPLENGSIQLHPPVPNTWLVDNKQDLLSPNVLDQDSDGDGFTTLDEFVGKTDPMNKNSHPPYWMKLVYTQFKPIPFRFRFDAKNGDTIQINTLDVEDAPTLFLKVGDMVKGTKFKVTKYEQKFSKAEGFNKDVSEVTLQNTETGETIVLPKAQEVDSPTTYAVLNYGWTGKPFAVKKNQEFTLKPEDSVKFKVLDLNDAQVHIVKEDDKTDIHLKMGVSPLAPTAASNSRSVASALVPNQ